MLVEFTWYEPLTSLEKKLTAPKKPLTNALPVVREPPELESHVTAFELIIDVTSFKRCISVPNVCVLGAIDGTIMLI
jgi:hypothetical protein